MPDSPTIFIACGGTGGHLFPGIAVAQALHARGAHAVLGISEKAVDSTAAAGYPDLEFMPMPAKPMPRLYSPEVAPFLWASYQGMRRCQTMLRARAVRAVLGMGGYTTFMPILAAKRAGIPVFLHDSNAIPGKANRMAARFAKTFFLGLDAAAMHLGNTPVQVVGTPVRDEFRQLPEHKAALARFGLSPDKSTLLVLGGSQGARALNRATIEAVAELDPDHVQAILLTGSTDLQATRDLLAKHALPHAIKVLEFCNDMPGAYACADIAVARAGASTLSELSMAGLPAILVPYPYAADDHQTANARAYAERDAAVLVPESSFDGDALATALNELGATPNRLAQMAQNMRNCALPGAAEAMAKHILSSLK